MPAAFIISFYLFIDKIINKDEHTDLHLTWPQIDKTNSLVFYLRVEPHVGNLTPYPLQ